MKVKAKTLSIIAAIVALAFYSFAGLADPVGPSISNGTAERRTAGIDSSAGSVVEAQAGNATALTINSTQLTDRWQGYYGNITGIITLDDAADNTLYSWEIATPQGEIYAVNHSTTPTWANVGCFNFSKNSDEQNITIDDLRSSLGMSATEDDDVNKTFNLTYMGGFSVGSGVTITSADECPLVSLYVDDNYDEANFNETILFDNASKEMITYVSIIEQSATGFQGDGLDFQMLVGENGDVVASTQYWFYVELS
jgi:hypothetical protein